jgi:hypothetical protein
MRKLFLTGTVVLLIATGTAHAIEYPYKEDSPEREWYTYSRVLSTVHRIKASTLLEMKRRFWLSVHVNGHSWPTFLQRKMRHGGGTITKHQPRWIRSLFKPM